MLPGRLTHLLISHVSRHIEDYWNVDGEKELSDAWTRFTRLILLNERPLQGYTWSGERLTRKQNTSRLGDIWPDMWTKMSDAAKKKAKQKWAIEKPKLDNAQAIARNTLHRTKRRRVQAHQSKPLEESWKFRCQQRCLAKYQLEALGKLTAILENAGPDLLALLMPTRAQD